MPKERPTIASFWVLRPDEHPEAEARNYPGMLRVLQHSCDLLGLQHVVLTDVETATSPAWPTGIQSWATTLPMPLMQAATEVQAQWLEYRRDKDWGDTLLVGADCIFIADPTNFYPREPGVCVTYRDPRSRYPINTGAVMVRRHSVGRAAALYRRVADRCGTVWCDDQRALIAELAPMPPIVGTWQRAGMSVAFLPMARFNVVPRSVEDPCRGSCMLHFRGKGRKQFFFDWAQRNGFA